MGRACQLRRRGLGTLGDDNAVALLLGSVRVRPPMPLLCGSTMLEFCLLSAMIFQSLCLHQCTFQCINAPSNFYDIYLSCKRTLFWPWALT